MTDEQINAAIAEACGWTDVHFSLAATDEFPTERRVVGIPAGHCTHNVVPNYCTDLNAIHDAESMLHRKKPEFSEILLELVSEAAGLGVQYAHGSFAHVHASARLRAEAFLRTLGKWEEEAK